MLGEGPNSGGIAARHGSDPKVSVNSVRVTTSTEEITSAGTDYGVYQAHGILMIAGWMVLISFSLIFARFYKDTLPDKKICGVQIWFMLHRVMNIVAIAAFIVPAFIMIFVEVHGLTKIASTDPTYLKTHTPLGIIVTILCLINPMMTLLRPGPDHQRRKLWNWFHWCIGYGSLLLSFVVIYIGFDMPKSRPFIENAKRDWVKYVTVVLMCVHVITWILLEVLAIRRRQKTRVDNYSKPVELSENPESAVKPADTPDKATEASISPADPNSKPKEDMRLRYVILFVYLAVVFILFLIITISIGSADTNR